MVDRIPLRLLLIDDSTDDALLVVRELKQGGYDVTSERVDTAAALSEALERGGWDAITCDWVMPRFSAPAALELIRQRQCDVPVIVVSGQVGEEVAATAMRAGAHDYVSKSKLARLVPAVERELRETEVRRARKSAEEALQESEDRYRDLVENSEDLLCTHDLEGRILSVNPAPARTLGYDRSEMLRMNIRDVLAPEFRAAFDEYLATLGREGVARGLMTVQTKAGKKRVWEYHNTLRTEGVCRPIVRGMAHDVTDRLHAERAVRKLTEDLERRVRERTAQLDAANKELEAFSYSVSHDLRAPLRYIEGFSRSLLERCGEQLDAESQRYLARIHAGAQRMDQLIRDLLGLSRVARAEMSWETVNLSVLARSIAADLQKRQPERRVEILIAPMIAVRGDAHLLRLALENLLANAWKYTGKHPTARIEFGTVERDGRTAYFVRDDGAGFDMRHAEKLFGAFQRLHSESEFEGTGVGLVTVKRIVRRHEGEIWAEAAVERGATFYFTLGSPGQEGEQ